MKTMTDMTQKTLMVSGISKNQITYLNGLMKSVTKRKMATLYAFGVFCLVFTVVSTENIDLVLFGHLDMLNEK